MKRIVVGLGNPGSRYEKTRHNIGWMVLDRLAERTGSVGRAKARDAAASVRGRLDDLEVVLVKPMTYMNLSGTAVRKVLARERAPLEDMLIVVDDMALPFGRLRLRERGSAGGHNGLRSIIGELGTEDFARLRVGIGAPARGSIEHVLGDFAHAEQGHLDLILEAATDAIEDWARTGAASAANRWNAWQPPLEAPPAAPGEAPEVGQAAVIVGQSAGRSEPAEAGVPAAGQVLDAGAPRAEVGPRPGVTPAPDADGIVHTTTGWRKLLPDVLRRRGGPGPS